MKRLYILLYSILIFTINIKSQEVSDSAKLTTDSLFLVTKSQDNLFRKIINGNLNLNLIITPYIDYSPETSWVFGIGGNYYISPKKENGKTGIIGFNGAYSLDKQWRTNFVSTIYLGKNQNWLLYLNTGYKRILDKFFGIGNLFNNLLLNGDNHLQPINYNSNLFYLSLKPQYHFNSNWIIGIITKVRIERITGLKKPILAQYNIVNSDTSLMIGLGGLIAYDSRDNIFYSSKGIYMQSHFTFYEKLWGSSYRLSKINFDFRHFIPLYKRQVIFAYQFISDITINYNKQPPFQLLSTFGGRNILRGIRSNTWKDDMCLVLQSELRVPIWKMFKGAFFASIGDVYSFRNWHFAKLKLGYGAGLRIQFNRSKAHVRIDVAKQNYDKKFYWYLTINEAF